MKLNKENPGGFRKRRCSLLQIFFRKTHLLDFHKIKREHCQIISTKRIDQIFQRFAVGDKFTVDKLF